MEGVFRFRSWFLNAPGLIHSGAYYRNFTVCLSQLYYNILSFLFCFNLRFPVIGGGGGGGGLLFFS